MQIIKDTTEFVLPKRSVVAIGKFDGMHLGHQKLFDRVLAQKEKGLLAAVFTFDPPPEAFFSGKAAKGLMSREEKRNAFEQMGIDVLIEFPMNKETAATEPEYFIKEYLAGKLRAAVITAGADISFGSRGAGDAGLLKKLSEEYGYRVEIIEKVSIAGERVSSTAIREAVRKGDMAKAELFLGASYQVNGVVSHGRELGRKLGMPTLNILPPDDKLLPPSGVYYSKVWLDNVRYPAISNVGCKPTVSRGQRMGVETYLYDFTGDVYGKEIVVELLDFKRAERKFDGVEALKAQMQKDIAEGAAWHGNRPA
ncbi:MAG: bifunctional riboflavin kinase/FAD synthetase [Clostridium sp.]|nr:bifunctional riboflavin kinase/FAD synthetase [Clostridium sp.]